MADYKHLKWLRTSERSFNVYYEYDCTRIEAEEINGVFKEGDNYNGFMAKKGKKYALYAKCCKYSLDKESYYYEGCQLVIDDILEYWDLGDIFFFKRKDGLYTFFTKNFLIGIGEELLPTVAFLTSKVDLPLGQYIDFEILDYEKIKFDNGEYARIIKLSCGNLIVYRTDFRSAQCVYCHKYTKIKGYSKIVRIYPEKNSRFFYVGSLTSLGSIDLCSSLTDLGNGYFVQKRGIGEQLILVEENRIKIVMGWGTYHVTKKGNEEGKLLLELAINI